MPIYSIYHLTLDSDMPLPELNESMGPADVTFRRGRIDGFDRWAIEEGGRRVQASRDRIGIFWEEAGACLIEGGRSIMIDALPGVEDDVVRLMLLGPAIALLLQQRGVTVLHASSVSVDGQGVAFVGEKGWGKSTLAAALHEQGCPLISDDLAVLGQDREVITIQSGPPAFKLWPEALEAVGARAHDLPRLHPSVEKRSRRVERMGAPHAVPLLAVFVLGYGPAPAVEPLGSVEALRALFPHWYGVRFGPEVFEALGPRNHLLQCTHLARHVHCARLVRRRGLDGLADTARRVQEHIVQWMGVAVR